MPYKDEKGHFTNKENAGDPCHHDEGGDKLSPKQAGFDDDYDEEFNAPQKYVPQTKIEKAVDEYIEQNWNKIDKNKSVGELAYKVSAMIGKPYPQVLDAVGKSIAARNEAEFDDGYTGREPGGIKGDLERAGFDDVEVVDDKTLSFTGPNAQKGWKIKENENLGFDVYNETGKKVIDDFNANTGNIATAMLQREQNPNMFEGLFADENEPDYRSMSIEEMDKAGFNGPHNNIINKLRNSVYDSVEEAMKDADRWNLDNKQRAYVEAYANKVFGEDFDNDWDLEDAISIADDDVLDDYFGKDTSERKLAAMIKNAKNNGQSAQQALDSVSYDADLEPGSDEFNKLKDMVKKEYDNKSKSMAAPKKDIVQKVNEMKDEFYGIDDKEKEAIINDLDNRDIARDKVQRNASKFADLMKQGKKKEAWDFLNTLSNEEVSLMFEKLGK